MEENKKFNQTKYTIEYAKEHYKRIFADIPKETAKKFEEQLEKDGITKAAFIKKAIEEYLQKNVKEKKN